MAHTWEAAATWRRASHAWGSRHAAGAFISRSKCHTHSPRPKVHERIDRIESRLNSLMEQLKCILPDQHRLTPVNRKEERVPLSHDLARRTAPRRTKRRGTEAVLEETRNHLLPGRNQGVNDRVEEMATDLMTGPKLSGEHIKALQSLLDNLWSYVIETGALRRLSEIDNSIVVACIAKRFTGGLAVQYRSQLVKYKYIHGRMPGLTWLRKFIAMEVEMLREKDEDPSCSYSSRSTAELTRERSTSSRRQAAQLATARTGKPKALVEVGQQSNTARPKCFVCFNSDQVMPHLLDECDAFKRMSVQTRRHWVQTLRLCVNCLKANHTADECRAHTQCDIPGCGENHSHWLHLDGTDNLWQAPVKMEAPQQTDDLRNVVKRRREQKVTEESGRSETYFKRRRSERIAQQQEKYRQLYQ
ncbi:uncharacterized protein LOC135111477 [Scylla paramamosain]|uniref:uncharacterized protein LOC135111477 n=1 Tax=Scylla paramamosain TaxID=85552 RepID=UPI003082F36B